MPPLLPPLLSLPRPNPDAALALTPRRGSQSLTSPFLESLSEALSSPPGFDSNQPKQPEANRSRLQAHEPAAVSRGDLRKQASIEPLRDLDADDDTPAVAHDAVDHEPDEGPDVDVESSSWQSARRSNDNEDAQESPDSAQASQADGAPVAADQENAAGETTSTQDEDSPATNSIGQPVHVDSASIDSPEQVRVQTPAQALASLQTFPTREQRAAQTPPTSASTSDGSATAAVAEHATSSAPITESRSSQLIADRMAPSVIVPVGSPDGDAPTNSGEQHATSADAPGPQAGAVLAANSAARVDASPQVQPHLMTSATSAGAASVAMTVGADAMNPADPDPLPSIQSHQGEAARARFNAQFAGSSASEPSPPAAARAAQVEAAIRLENATGVASPQDATTLRALQSVAGTGSGGLGSGMSGGGGSASHGQGLGAHADSSLPGSSLTLGLDDDRFSGRIVRGLSAMVNQRGGVMLMRLDPPELGQLRVQMTIQRGIVSAQFDAASPEARALLDKSMAVLRTALESHGLTVERLSVHHLPAPNPSTWNDDRSSPNPQQQASQRHDADAGGGQSRGRRDDEPSRFDAPSRDEGAFARDFDTLTSSAA